MKISEDYSSWRGSCEKKKRLMFDLFACLGACLSVLLSVRLPPVLLEEIGWEGWGREGLGGRDRKCECEDGRPNEEE